MSDTDQTGVESTKRSPQRTRFEAVAEAINRRQPDAAATLIEDDKGALHVSVYVGGNLQAWFKGQAGTWRGDVMRMAGDSHEQIGSKLTAAGAIAYKEKDADRVAAAIFESVNAHRAEILDYGLMLEVAERVIELRPASGAKVKDDSPGGFLIQVNLDGERVVHFRRDVNWGGRVMRKASRAGRLEYANHSLTTDAHHTEADPAKIAEAIVSALDDYTPQN
jgi:hypothetical protein